jgi:hypothetical protein
MQPPCLILVTLTNFADISTIAACVTAILALACSSWQFIATQKSTRESQAVSLFLKFNELNIAQGIQNSEKSNFWYENSKFAITESLFEIAHKSETWRTTIRWMLNQQNVFIKDGGFDDVTYSEEFRKFCKECGFEPRREYAKQQSEL